MLEFSVAYYVDKRLETADLCDFLCLLFIQWSSVVHRFRLRSQITPLQFASLIALQPHEIGIIKKLLNGALVRLSIH